MSTEAGFWDTSALVPLCCYQPATSIARRWARRFGRMVVWWGTRIEAYSALSRLRREGALTTKTAEQAFARLVMLGRSWRELLPVEAVREEAEALLAHHALTAPDSLQLAAALIWCQHRPQRRPFLCLDERLAAAAAQAGFEVPGTSS